LQGKELPDGIVLVVIDVIYRLKRFFTIQIRDKLLTEGYFLKGKGKEPQERGSVRKLPRRIAALLGKGSARNGGGSVVSDHEVEHLPACQIR